MTNSRNLSIALLALSLAAGSACQKKTATEPTTTPTSATYFSVVMPGALSMAVGDSTQLRSVAALRDGTYQVVTTSGTWASSDANVASVDTAGIVRAVAQGGADITLTLDGLTTTTAVTVSSNATQPTTYWGTAAVAGADAGTLTLSLAAPPRVSGTLFLKGTAIVLTGRVDAPTSIVNVGGGGYTFLGAIKGGVVSGTFADPAGALGGFSAIDATRTAVTTFCGTYTSDGTTNLGNADTGTFGLNMSLDGAVTASSVPSDASSVPFLFLGRRDGDSIALTETAGGTLTGSVQSGTTQGGFQTSAASAATFTATVAACH